METGGEEMRPHSDTAGASSDMTLRREWPALLGVVLFVVVLMWPFTFAGQALMPDTWKSIHPWARGIELHGNQTNVYDTVLEYSPWFEYAQQCLKEGRVPHWNPWQFCGAPLYANRLIPFFFPPFLAALLVGSPHRLIGWFQLLNLIFSGWGMYFLLRRWNMTRSVAWAGSCLYLTCGVHYLPFPLWTLGTMGFPWLLWALEGFLRQPGLRAIATAGLIAGFILMVGYPVLVVHLTYFTAVYFIARWMLAGKGGWLEISGRRVKRLHWSVAIPVLLAVYILGFGVSAIANVPAWVYSQHSVRQVEGFSDKSFQRGIRQLATPEEEQGFDPFVGWVGERVDMVLPVNGRGNQRAWQYGGVLLYLLAFLGILAGRPRALLLAVLGGAFALMIWIPEVYLFLAEFLPGWQVSLVLPIEVLNLSVCLLAAFGIETLLGGGQEKDQPNALGRAVFAVLTIGAMFLAYWFLRSAPVVNLPILSYVPDRNMLAHSSFHIFYLVAFLVIAAAGAVLLFVRKSASPARWSLVGGMLVFSLATQWYLQPVYSSVDYMPTTPFTKWLEEECSSGEGGRIARWAMLDLPFNPHKRAKSPFTPNLQMHLEVPDVGGYDSLVPGRFIEYCDLFESAFIDYRALIAFREASTPPNQGFRNLGVRWIISLGELPEESREGCRLVWDDRYDGEMSIKGTDDSDDFIQVWELDDPEPRAFLTRRLTYSNDPFDDPLVQAINWEAQGIRVVVIEDPEGENRAFVFPEEAGNGAPLTLEGSSVAFERDEPELVRLRVHAPDECYLILRDGWYPEWEARIDGGRTTIYPADAAFRAVRVPQGDHVVEFRYVPRSFRVGMWITIAGLLVLLGLWLVPQGGSTRYVKPTASNR